MGWFFDLLRDLFTLLITDYRSKLLQFLVLLVVFLLGKNTGKLAETMNEKMKDKALPIALMLLASFLYLTLDDPFLYSAFVQFAVATILLIIVFKNQVKEASKLAYAKIRYD